MIKHEVAIESATEAIVEAIYETLINSWNETNARVFSDLFSENGSMVGFDGSVVNGKQEIYEHLLSIFGDHTPAKFVSIIKDIKVLCPTVGLLRATVGMVPPGQKTVNPKTNAIQSLLVVNEMDHFRIALFQNTPAAFHGRPELVKQLTNELQQEFLHQQKVLMNQRGQSSE